MREDELRAELDLVIAKVAVNEKRAALLAVLCDARRMVQKRIDVLLASGHGADTTGR